jgi:dsRNA-specific ribonuclease
LDDFWDNCWDPPQDKIEPKKKDHWRELETIGDAYLNSQIHELLVKMCGEENFGLIKVLKEHAKSNPFLVQLGKHYKLDEWVRIRPRHYPKHWADLMEAWIGAVIKERTLYDAKDPLEDLELFLEGLLTIRYRKLEGVFP